MAIITGQGYKQGYFLGGEEQTTPKYERDQYYELNDWLVTQIKNSFGYLGVGEIMSDEEFRNMLVNDYINPHLGLSELRQTYSFEVHPHHLTQALAMIATQTGILDANDPKGESWFVRPQPSATKIDDNVYHRFSPFVDDNTLRNIGYTDDQIESEKSRLKDLMLTITEQPEQEAQLQGIKEDFGEMSTQIHGISYLRYQDKIKGAPGLDKRAILNAFEGAGLSMLDFSPGATKTLVAMAKDMFSDAYLKAEIQAANPPAGSGQIPKTLPPISSWVELQLNDPEIKADWTKLMSEELGLEFGLTKEEIANGELGEGYSVTNPFTGETTFHDKTTAIALAKEYDDLFADWVTQQDDQRKEAEDKETKRRAAMSSIPEKERLYIALKDSVLFEGETEQHIRTWIHRNSRSILKNYASLLAQEIADGADPILEITTLENYIEQNLRENRYSSKLPPETYTTAAGVVIDWATDEPKHLLTFAERRDPKKDIFSQAALDKALAKEEEDAFARFTREEVMDPKYQREFMAKQARDITDFAESPTMGGSFDAEGKRVPGAFELGYAKVLEAQKEVDLAKQYPGHEGLPTNRAEEEQFPPDQLTKLQTAQMKLQKAKESQASLGKAMSAKSLQELGRTDTLKTALEKDKAARRKRFEQSAAGKKDIENQRKLALTKPGEAIIKPGKMLLGKI